MAARQAPKPIGTPRQVGPPQGAAIRPRGNCNQHGEVTPGTPGKLRHAKTGIEDTPGTRPLSQDTSHWWEGTPAHADTGKGAHGRHGHLDGTRDLGDSWVLIPALYGERHQS